MEPAQTYGFLGSFCLKLVNIFFGRSRGDAYSLLAQKYCWVSHIVHLTMKVKYNAEVDALVIRFSDKTIDESGEDKPACYIAE